MVSLKSRVGPKGQAVIPKPIRDELGIRPGDTLSYTLHEGHVDVKKTNRAGPTNPWESLFTMFPKTKIPADYDWDAESEEMYDP